MGSAHNRSFQGVFENLIDCPDGNNLQAIANLFSEFGDIFSITRWNEDFLHTGSQGGDGLLF